MKKNYLILILVTLFSNHLLAAEILEFDGVASTEVCNEEVCSEPSHKIQDVIIDIGEDPPFGVFHFEDEYIDGWKIERLVFAGYLNNPNCHIGIVILWEKPGYKDVEGKTHNTNCKELKELGSVGLKAEFTDGKKTYRPLTKVIHID